jgi:hypothetical protein
MSLFQFSVKNGPDSLDYFIESLCPFTSSQALVSFNQGYPGEIAAAGDQDEATPSAENVVTAGQAINFVVAGGGSGGAPRIHLVAVITR